eukprot:260996-Prymnesium_polylepis.1
MSGSTARLYGITVHHTHTPSRSPYMFGPGRAYEARGTGACRTISSSASVHAVARITAGSAKKTARRRLQYQLIRR